MPIADVQPVLRADKTEKFQNVIIVVKRLADTHQNDTGELFSCLVLRINDLRKHFSRQEPS